jgi:hypothetical protein
MLETIKFPTDGRQEACGFHIGQRVIVINVNGGEGTIIGFGPAWHKGCTVKVQLDSGRGNMGTHHSVGSRWARAL